MHPLTRFELFFPLAQMRFDEIPLPDEELISCDTDGAGQEPSLAPEMDGRSCYFEPLRDFARRNVRLIESFLGNEFRRVHRYSLVQRAPQHTGARAVITTDV